MGKSLIIAEKPSVARDIAAALGGFKALNGVLESADAVITNGIGHLVSIGVPPDSDRGWDLSVLPFIPPSFVLEPVERTKAQLNIVGKLLKRDDIDTVINACDAGREGELIFRYIYLIHRCKKPIKRMWLQSMTKEAIIDAHTNMRSDKELIPLFQAAVSRSEADWLVGVNATRALTKLREIQGNEKDGVTSAGRVQSPVLSLLYYREKAIKEFVPRDFWEIHGAFSVAAGSYDGKWFDPKFERTDDDTLQADRLYTKEAADAVLAKCKGVNPSSVTEVTKPSKTSPPKLFDLTTLQREANTKFGFTAKTTLDLAQALYETHKVLTYPRTDATALPEDYIPTAKQTLAGFAGTTYAEHASRVLSNDWVVPNKSIFDNSKISDHFAIVPNGKKPSGLSAEEQKIYELVSKRFIAAFYPDAEYLKTTRITVVADESFKSAGSVIVSEGWMAVYGADASKDDDKAICRYVDGEPAKTDDVSAVAKKTTPPSRYTEATLLGAMENAGKTIDDAELKEAMKERGLGTPATRAAIIEELLSDRRNYAYREKKFLVPTTKGMEVVALMLKIGIDALTSAQMTGEWEFKLNLIEKGELTRADFMEEVRKLTTHIVTQIKGQTAGIADAVDLHAPCPKCKGTVVSLLQFYSCQSCDLRLPSKIAGRALKIAEAEQLLSTGRTSELKGFHSSKSKKDFDAALVLSAEFDKISFEFSSSTNSADRVTVGTCPKCKADVIERKGNYFCEKNDGEDKKCDFVLWGTAAKKVLPRSEIQKLLTNGKTSLISGFMGAKGGFKAYLVMGSDHKTTFEFEKR